MLYMSHVIFCCSIRDFAFTIIDGFFHFSIEFQASYLVEIYMSYSVVLSGIWHPKSFTGFSIGVEIRQGVLI